MSLIDLAQVNLYHRHMPTSHRKELVYWHTQYLNWLNSERTPRTLPVLLGIRQRGLFRARRQLELWAAVVHKDLYGYAYPLEAPNGAPQS